ncbi:Di-sulfide bridge nucleocytoplasmic transport domain-containing protein [Trichoderma chlorosporum]
MERRTFEAPMEWEYQNSGPVDLTSPFAQVAKKRSDNLFSLPHKPSTTTQGTSLSVFGTPVPTPSKPPTRSFFTPQLAPKVVAPPFRNPAFTTPRNLDDATPSDTSFTDAEGSFTTASFVSCAEDSPAVTDVSAFHNDTPESDRLSEATISNTTPTKIDKTSRYSRNSPRRHAAGRGEIRPLSRDTELQVLRKRKRHNLDKDVSSVIRHLPPDWEGDTSDSDTSMTSYRGASASKIAPRSAFSSQQKHHLASTPQSSEGWFVSALGTMDRYPLAPDHIYRWLQLGFNCLVAGIVMYIIWSIYDAVRADFHTANEMTRMEIMSRITECQNHYTSNECAKRRDLPALRALCDDWYDCMSQDTDGFMRVRVTMKEIAEVINVFAATMNLKAWIMFAAIAVFVIFSNVMLGWGRSRAQVAPAHPAAFSHVPMMAPDATPAHFRARFETPRSQRYAFLEGDVADTDMSPSRIALPGYSYTISGRRSPDKAERSASPIKYHRSPNKGERSGGSLRW